MNWDNAPAWVQAVGSVAAIFAAIWIARWQAEKDRRLRREEVIATAEVVGASVTHIATTMSGRLRDLAQGLNQKNQGNGFDARQHHVKIRALVLPSESQLLHLAPVINAGAIGLARASAWVTQIANDLEFIAKQEEGPMTLVFKDAQLQSLEPTVSQALADLTIGQAGLMDLLAHKKAPDGRQVIQH
jgi:hypothetical protein